MAWVALPDTVPAQRLDGILLPAGLAGLILFGPAGKVRIGARENEVFERRVKAVFDPAGRLPDLA